jgi:hypothetical protein
MSVDRGREAQERLNDADESGEQGYYWRGPITSQRRATLIISWAGMVFFLVGALAVVTAIVGALVEKDMSFATSKLLSAAVLIVPSFCLMKFKSRVAAGALLALALVALFVAVGIALEVVNVRDWKGEIIGVPVCLLSATVALLTWRALWATIALRRMRRDGPAPVTVAATFG